MHAPTDGQPEYIMHPAYLLDSRRHKTLRNMMKRVTSMQFFTSVNDKNRLPLISLSSIITFCKLKQILKKIAAYLQRLYHILQLNYKSPMHILLAKALIVSAVMNHVNSAVDKSVDFGSCVI